MKATIVSLTPLPRVGKPSTRLRSGFVSRWRDFQGKRTMTHYLFIIVGAVLVNNVVLVKILGLCPFTGVSKKLETAFGMGAATTFVLTVATGASYVIDHYLLMPFGLEYLRTLSFIVTIAAIVQLTEMVIQKTSPLLHQVLGIYLPLITTNCAVLGVPC
jgi:electron transport complex protein RnfA